MLTSSVWRGRSRWWFSGGLLAGGFTTALVAIALGSLFLRPLLPWVAEIGLAGAVFGLIVLNEFGLITLPLPQNGRQVPQSVIDDGPRYGALQFGFEMGTGVRTFMISGLPHALLATVLLVAAWPEALIAGVAFGGGRAWMTLARHAYPEKEVWDTALRKRDRLIRVVLTVVFASVLGLIVHHVIVRQ